MKTKLKVGDIVIIAYENIHQDEMMDNLMEEESNIGYVTRIDNHLFPIKVFLGEGGVTPFKFSELISTGLSIR